MSRRPRPAGGSHAGFRQRLQPLLVLAAGLQLMGGGPPALAASQLLDQVKSKPEMARGYCARFSQLNAEGVSATSKASIDEVARRQSISPMDAEVMITYIIGLYCPDTR
ncbi:MAG: hypothetical protein EBU88_18090 [Acidobacteria bacterium]|nr:hypothetical protein [Acidobacteriota bacterium]